MKSDTSSFWQARGISLGRVIVLIALLITTFNPLTSSPTAAAPNYNGTGDYSFDPTKTSFADWTRVTLYRNDVLVWGVEP